MLDRSTNCNGYESRIQEVRQELLELILQDSNEVSYPWNPADSETEAYCARLEREFTGIEEGDELESNARSASFLGQLQQCWASGETAGTRKSLVDRFGDCVPHDWLEKIAHQAQALLSSSFSPTEQLVECVKPLLGNWAEADLYVFARPLAQAMRSATQPEPETRNWEQLSQVERAKYVMKIARYALVELGTTNGNGRSRDGES
ncbi:MAG: hypothetical protein SVX43_00465 [Cyanobacteriota bacterium]|nr:hypothetical protein [Cyanobacteriota bacterium]